MAGQRNGWGSVRKLPSGRYQARYQVDHQTFRAPTTFATKREADDFLAGVRADLRRGLWIDPAAASVTLRDYAWDWLGQHPGLRPRTRELYESELRLHILPVLGDVGLGDLTVARVRSWRAGLLHAGRRGPSTVAKCYRLLRTISNTAVDDERIGRNPCVIRGAGPDRSAVLPHRASPIRRANFQVAWDRARQAPHRPLSDRTAVRAGEDVDPLDHGPISTSELDQVAGDHRIPDEDPRSEEVNRGRAVVTGVDAVRQGVEVTDRVAANRPGAGKPCPRRDPEEQRDSHYDRRQPKQGAANPSTREGLPRTRQRVLRLRLHAIHGTFTVSPETVAWTSARPSPLA